MKYLHEELIWIDPDFLEDTKKIHFTTPSAYEDWVTRIIGTIGCSEVGRIVLRCIKYHGKTVRIAPVTTNPFDPGIVQSASAAPGEAKDLIFNRHIRPLMPSIAGFTPRPVRAVVRFTPNHYADGGAHNRFSKDHHHYAATVESVLLHELVHAFRSVSGTYDPARAALGNLRHFDSLEEFYAVLVENIYQSEMKRNIRANHHGHFNLDPQLAGSFEFFRISTQAFDLVERFCKENAGLTRALAKVKVPFNPFAAFYQNREKAKSFSASAEAIVREKFSEVINVLTPTTDLNVWRKLSSQP